MKKQKQVKKILYLDYLCKVGERVRWENIKREKFEGVIIAWDDNKALIRLDDGTEHVVEC